MPFRRRRYGRRRLIGRGYRRSLHSVRMMAGRRLGRMARRYGTRVRRPGYSTRTPFNSQRRA